MSELNKLKMRKDALLSSKGLTMEEEENIEKAAMGHVGEDRQGSTQELIDQNYRMLQGFRSRLGNEEPMALANQAAHLPHQMNDIASTFRTEHNINLHQLQETDLGAYLKRSQASIASSFPTQMSS